jgi:hypothetical protein
MDFRPLDKLNTSDQDLIEHPYKPFYNFLSIKPALVKQYVHADPNSGFPS